MTTKVILTPEAKADIQEIASWYADRSGRVADKFLLAISEAMTRIEAQPTAQVIVDPSTGTRRALVRKFPHRLLYFIDGTKLVVFAVIHHRRNDPAWRERLLP